MLKLLLNVVSSFLLIQIILVSWQDGEQPKDQAQQDLGRPEWRDFSLQLRSVFVTLPLCLYM